MQTYIQNTMQTQAYTHTSTRIHTHINLSRSLNPLLVSSPHSSITLDTPPRLPHLSSFDDALQPQSNPKTRNWMGKLKFFFTLTPPLSPPIPPSLFTSPPFVSQSQILSSSPRMRSWMGKWKCLLRSIKHSGGSKKVCMTLPLFSLALKVSR